MSATTMTTSEPQVDLPDLGELTRLANAFFQALPGESEPSGAAPGPAPQGIGSTSIELPQADLPQGGGPEAQVLPIAALDAPLGVPSDLPLSLLSSPFTSTAPVLAQPPVPAQPIGSAGPQPSGVPTDATSASQVAGGVAPESTPSPVSGPPSDAALRGANAANPVPMPTEAALGAVPGTLTRVMGFVAGIPGAPEADVPGSSPSAYVPDALPGAPTVQQLADPVDTTTTTEPADHSTGLPASVPTASLGVFEFRPEMLPSLEGTTAAARPFDPYAIRRDFPILSERVNGRPLIWLDNGATTQKPQAVIDRISYFYEHENSNIHRAAHTLAARSTDAYEGAREKVRRFLNASSAKEIVFVRGATEAINLVAKSWGVANVGEGDEVLVTHLEHHANIVPWQQLCQQVGATLKVAPVDDTGQIILSEYERAITSRTKIVAMTQVSNALGTITPVAEMVAIAHRHGARTLVDAAQSVLHMRVDVQALGTDFLVFSGHKMFAPTGIGVVYGTAEVWDVTPPWQGGGNMIADVTFERTIYQPPPNRFEAGTGNIADAVGLGAAVDYLTGVGIENVTAYEHELLEYGTDGLLSIPGLRIIGTAVNKAAVMSFVLDGHSPEEIGTLLDKEGIAVRAGHHCAQPILRRFGVEATVRPSLAMYNTREDLDCLVAAVRRIQADQHRGI
jgi:cysteine desulfurase/selenocysteine lyase